MVATWTIRSRLAEIARHTPLSMSVEEYEWVYRFAGKADPPRLLDIGTHHGLSALVMLEANPQAEILTIDNLADFGNDQKGAMRTDCGRLIKDNKNVTKVWGDSQHLVPLIHTPFGLALIDGSHWYRDIARDIENCREKDIPIILVHDALDEGPAKALETHRHRLLPAERIGAEWDIEPRGLAILETEERDM